MHGMHVECYGMGIINSFYNETMTDPCSHVWSYNDETMTCLYVMMVRCLVYEVVLMKQ